MGNWRPAVLMNSVKNFFMNEHIPDLVLLSDGDILRNEALEALEDRTASENRRSQIAIARLWAKAFLYSLFVQHAWIQTLRVQLYLEFKLDYGSWARSIEGNVFPSKTTGNEPMPPGGIRWKAAGLLATEDIEQLYFSLNPKVLGYLPAAVDFFIDRPDVLGKLQEDVRVSDLPDLQMTWIRA